MRRISVPDNPEQFDRLAAIFRELKAKVEFLPVDTAIHEGFADHDLKIAVLTDHQIFNAITSTKSGRAFPRSNP